MLAFLLTLAVTLHLSWDATFLEATRTPLAAPQLPGSDRAQSSRADSRRSFASGDALPLVALAAAAGLAAATVRTVRVRRRVHFSYNTDTLMPGSEFPDMTVDEEAAWVAEKSAELEEISPMTHSEYLGEVEDLHYAFQQRLLPFRSNNKGMNTRTRWANQKRKTLLCEAKFFQKIRLWKPLAMKYPTLLKRYAALIGGGHQVDLENRKMMVNASFLKNAEFVAGFSYLDFLKETNGLEFDNWAMPKVGDTVTGTIVDVGEDGAFVSIGAKSWALLPVANASLKPVNTIGQAGLRIGDEIQAVIVESGVQSKVPGDPNGVQDILSTKDLQLNSAWEKVVAAYNLEEGTEHIQKVTVLRMEGWGAVVINQDGLQGAIRNRELGNQAGNPGLIGQTLEASIVNLREDKKDTFDDAIFADDFPVEYTYKDVAKQALAKNLEEGMVLEAKVLEVLPASVEVEVQGVSCTISKTNVTGAPGSSFQMTDVFRIDEIIKVYVMDVLEKDGQIKLSTRALERKRGAMLRNKAKVFQMAEETAKLFFERSQAQKNKVFESLAGIGDVLDGGIEGLKAPKKTQASSVLGDEDDDDLGGF